MSKRHQRSKVKVLRLNVNRGSGAWDAAIILSILLYGSTHTHWTVRASSNRPTHWNHTFTHRERCWEKRAKWKIDKKHRHAGGTSSKNSSSLMMCWVCGISTRWSSVLQVFVTNASAGGSWICLFSHQQERCADCMYLKHSDDEETSKRDTTAMTTNSLWKALIILILLLLQRLIKLWCGPKELPLNLL